MSDYTAGGVGCAITRNEAARDGKVYYLTQSVHGKKKFRFGFRFFYLTTDILNVNPDVFTLSYSREKNESMEDGNIGDEARYKMFV